MLQYIIYKHNQYNEVGMEQQDAQKTMSDDQELAKVLAGVSQAADDNLNFEETGAAPAYTPPMPEPTDPAADVSIPVATPDPAPVEDSSAPVFTVSNDPVVPAADPVVVTDPALDTIKQSALNELRPLVGKLNVSPEEKFDTYLLLLRSTDDKDLIAPAHDAAIAITDEARRAQALLDIIKEIDYLSAPRG